ncbi:MAG: tetratricopeptide repeat protein [Pirellulales bacterium]
MPPSPQDSLTQIRQLQSQRQWQAAYALCQQITAEQPQWAEAWNQRGVVELNLAKFGDAAVSWREAIRLAPDQAAFHHNLASALRRQHDWEGARQSYQRAVELAPGSVESRVWLAECWQRRGEIVEAERHYRLAVGAAPGNARALVGLGLCLHFQQRDAEAIGLFERALTIDPTRPEIQLNLGTSLRKLGRLLEAVGPLREAVRLRPDYAKAHCGLGIVYALQNNWVDALAEFQLAVRYQPDSAEAHDELGKALAYCDRQDEAEAAHREALRLQPEYVNAWVNLGVLYVDSGRAEQARVCLERARELRPSLPEAHNNLGIAYKSLERLDEAEACYRKALELRPRYAKAHYNLGNVHLERAQWDEALACYERALELAPDYAEPRFERGVVRLTLGQLTEGWRDYEARWEMRNGRGSRRRFPVPAWQGEPLAGRTLLIYCEQGLGDTLQFIRYAPLARRYGAGRVIVECQPRLLRLLGSLAGVDQLVPRGSPLPDFDCHAALLSLPGLCGTQLDSIPAQTPYLSADTDLVERWRERLGAWPGYRVGIAWQGSPTYLRDASRSIPLSSFAPLAQVPGVRLIGLQYGPGAEQRSAVADQFPVIDLGDDVDRETGGFMDTAAIVQSLDLVISPDSSLNHLCGALGVECWLALPLAPDWRWLLDREDSPWYPTVRIFRQRKWHDWDELLARVATELRRRVTG